MKSLIRHLLILALPVLLAACQSDGTSTSFVSVTYTISGTVSGLTGTGLVLQNNGADDKPIAVDGAFSFTLTSQVASGTSYAITVKTQPTAPSQTCTVTNGTGSLSTANISGIVVTCENGRFAYVANSGTNDVSAYAINGTTGELTQVLCGGGAGCNVNNFLAGTQPGSVAVDPAGKFAYVLNSGSDDVSAYMINATTGELSSVAAAVPAGSQPNSITLDPSGKFAYVANSGSNDVSAYTIDTVTGELTSVGATVAAGGNPTEITVDPSGAFAYVVNNTSHDISAYTIDSVTGELTSVGATVAAGTNPAGIAVDPTGMFAYVANFTSNNISVYTIDSVTGELTSVSATVAGTNPTGIAVDPTGNFAYVTNFGSNDVSAYTINATTGELTQIPCGGGVGCNVNNFSAGTQPNSITVDATGKFAYVTNFGSGDISVYTIDSVTGELTSVGATVAAGSGPVSIRTTH